MSWDDFITQFVLTIDNDVDKIVVYDTTGFPVAVSADLKTTSSEGLAVINTILDPGKNITRLYIDSECFTCMQGINGSMLGSVYMDQSRIIVGQYTSQDHAVVVMGPGSDTGSLLSELRTMLARRDMINLSLKHTLDRRCSANARKKYAHEHEDGHEHGHEHEDGHEHKEEAPSQELTPAEKELPHIDEDDHDDEDDMSDIAETVDDEGYTANFEEDRLIETDQES